MEHVHDFNYFTFTESVERQEYAGDGSYNIIHGEVTIGECSCGLRRPLSPEEYEDGTEIDIRNR